MNLEKAVKELITICLNANIGDQIPSIHKLSIKYSCSRGIFQKAIIYLETNNLIQFTHESRATKISSINYINIQKRYYSELVISLPLVSLDNKLDNIALDSLNYIASTLPGNTYLSFSDSGLTRLNNLENDKSHFCIISEAYYQQLNSIQYPIVQTHHISTPVQAKLINTSPTTLEYGVDEICDDQKRYASDKSSLSDYYFADTYYLITKPYIKSLIDNITA